MMMMMQLIELIIKGGLNSSYGGSNKMMHYK